MIFSLLFYIMRDSNRIKTVVSVYRLALTLPLIYIFVSISKWFSKYHNMLIGGSANTLIIVKGIYVGTIYQYSDMGKRLSHYRIRFNFIYGIARIDQCIINLKFLNTD